MAKIDSPERIREKCAERKALREKKGPLTKTGNPVGRPKGGSLLQKMINEAKPKDVKAVYRALVEAGTDPDHKNFAYANKALADRWAHTSNYERKTASTTPVVNINIGDVGPVTVEGEVIEG